MIQALQTADCEVTLFGTSSETWSSESLRETENALHVRAHVYSEDDVDKYYLQSLRKTWKDNFLPWDKRIPPGLKRYFIRVVLELKPQVIFINSGFFAKLVLGRLFKSMLKIIDTHDLLSLYQQMARDLHTHLSRCRVGHCFEIGRLEPEFLREDYFFNKSFSVDSEEYRLYDKFDITFAINPVESEMMRLNTQRTQVEYMPFTFNKESSPGTYDEPPVFAIGPNAFNFQAYAFFAIRILPKILAKEPDFLLRVVGDGCRYLPAYRGIRLDGFVSDIQAVYSKSKFAVCPMIGGTGQQLKVMEAMSHSLPVVVMKNVADRCPVRHGVNGFVASTPDEFSEYVIRLFQSPELCRDLGRNARQTIEENYTTKKSVLKIKRMLENIPFRKPAHGIYIILVIEEIKYAMAAFKTRFFYWANRCLRFLKDRFRLIKVRS